MTMYITMTPALSKWSNQKKKKHVLELKENETLVQELSNKNTVPKRIEQNQNILENAALKWIEQSENRGGEAILTNI